MLNNVTNAEKNRLEIFIFNAFTCYLHKMQSKTELS